MVVAASVVPFKVDCSPVELARQLELVVQQAAQEGCALHVVERQIFDSVLKMGHAATEMFLQTQGDGDLGKTCLTKSGETLVRSEQPVDRPLQTVFGRHTIRAYV